MEIVRQFTSLIMPPACLLCGTAVPGGGILCRGCLDDLPETGRACPVCGVAQTSATICGRCQHSPPAFDRVITACDYRFPADTLIRAFKYRRSLLAARALAPVLAARIRCSCTRLPPVMVPVPLHRSRLYRRGYNQSLEIARALRRDLGTEVDTRLVRRHRPTREQTHLDPGERRRNLKNAFSIQRDCVYESIAIVDDVVTTGTTVNELAKLLRKNGVKEIQVWALARASDKA